MEDFGTLVLPRAIQPARVTSREKKGRTCPEAA